MENEMIQFSGVVTHVVKDKEVVLYVTYNDGSKETRSFPKTLFNDNVKVDDEFNGVITSGSGWMQIDLFNKAEQLEKYKQGGEIDIVERAKLYAISCHEKVNQMYDGKPYSYHLGMAVDFGEMFIELIPEQHRKNVISGIWGHDLSEDCRKTFNDIKKSLNKEVAELVYAVTNEKGKTRAERANSKYYTGIRITPFAKFIKLADRLANVKHSHEKYKLDPLLAGSMFDKYYSENPKFIWSLIKPEWYEIHQHLLRLLMGSKLYGRYRKVNDKYYPMIMYLENILNEK
jgi:hypothetical protein